MSGDWKPVVGEEVKWASSPVTGECYDNPKARGIVKAAADKSGRVDVTWNGWLRRVVPVGQIEPVSGRPLGAVAAETAASSPGDTPISQSQEDKL